MNKITDEEINHYLDNQLSITDFSDIDSLFLLLFGLIALGGIIIGLFMLLPILLI